MFWKDVVEKNIKDYKYRYTIHPIDNELEVLHECIQLENFIMVAKEFYLKLIKNHNN